MTATTEPTAITAGDTVAWDKTLADYPAGAGWTLSYVLVRPGARIAITSTPTGDAHRVAVAASASAGWAAGRYEWQAFVERASERFTVGRGVVTVAPNLAAAGPAGVDTRSAARAALDAMDEALRVYGSKAYLQSYAIGGRQQTFRNPAEFLAFRSKLQGEVKREEAAGRLRAGIGGGKSLQVRFRP